MTNKYSNKYYVNCIWHFKVEDGLGWEFCAGILAQDGTDNISAETLQGIFEQFFIELTGIAPYTKCPSCGELLLPRRSEYGHFVGCSKYPACKFLASNTKKYKPKSRRAPKGMDKQ